MKPLTHCILTDLPVTNFASNEDVNCPQFSYSVTISQPGLSIAPLFGLHYISKESSVGIRKPTLTFCQNCFSDERLFEIKRDYAHLLKPHHIIGHLLNGKLNSLLGRVIHLGLGDENEPKKEGGLISILEGINYPKTRQELLDNLLFCLNGFAKFEGDLFERDEISQNDNWRRLYFSHIAEFNFYFDALCDKGFLRAVDKYHGERPKPWITYQLTFSGLNYLAELEEKGHNSQSVFVAMCFHQGMEETRRAIKSAIEANGLSPILIDESQYPSHQTINDALILAIKRSKFIVADFTENRNAVYWEAGYALGLGKEVILTCHREHFQSVDFDTKAFPHIIYDTTDDLRRQLEDRIRVRFG